MRPLQYRDVTKEQLVNRIDDLATIIEAKEKQIEALVTVIQDFMLNVPGLWGDHVIDGKIMLNITASAIDDFERVIKEATGCS